MIKLLPKGKKVTLKESFSITAATPYIPNHRTTVTVKPYDKSIKFIINRGHKKVSIPVRGENNLSAKGLHTTILGNSKGKVRLTEHLLSALTGMGVTACEIELINSDQVPVPDRTAETYSKLIAAAGLKKTRVDNIVAVVTKDIYFTDGMGSLAILQPSGKTKFFAFVQFKQIFEDQFFKIELNPENYWNEIMWARSFLTRECENERDWREVVKRLPSLPSKMKNSPVVVKSRGKWVTGIKPLEPVRHKILDAIGDLTTLGYPILADITLIRPGHEFHHKLVNYLWDLIQRGERNLINPQG